MSGKRILFYVQHLLGIGHLRRAATVTRALVAAGLDVTLVSGGHSIPNLDLGGAKLRQLPATRAVDLLFKELVDENGRPIDKAWRARRRDQLMAIWREVDPHALVTELYPFGRRQMRFELLPLLDDAKTRTRQPLVVSSVRDIIQTGRLPERYMEMTDIVNRHFDHVLVHGDPQFIPFGQTFDYADAIVDRLHYTGYVVDDRGTKGAPGADGWKEIIVSVGGGSESDELLRCAIAAKPMTSVATRRWRILAGVKMPQADFDALCQRAPANVVVERARGDFPSLLMNATLLISQAGYNTTMEALRAGCRAVVVPYAAGRETEQTLRATLLADRGALHVVPEAELTPVSLAAAVDRAMAAPSARDIGLNTDGAAESARALTSWTAALDW